MTASGPVLSVRGVSKAYRGVAVVRDASLGLFSGRITCLLGPSGCGKSTLLRLVAGLERLDAGEIECAGRIISSATTHEPPETRGVGLVFQELALFPHLTAVQNVAFGLRGMSAQDKRARALELLEQFQLGHRIDAWPHMLSGGEQQRVAIARALAVRPEVVLLDEPFSGLDGALKADVRGSVLQGLRAAKASVLVVTHDPEEALLVGDELVLMSGGRVLQAGTPEDCYRRPVSLAAARLLGDAVSVPSYVRGGVAETPFGRLAADGLPDGPAITMLRPESVELHAEGAPAELRDVRFGGGFHEALIVAGDSAVPVKLYGDAPAAGPVKVRLRADRTMTWPAAS